MDRRLLWFAVAIIIAGAIYTAQYLPDEEGFKGTAAVGLTIIYEDGTNETITPETKPTAYFTPLAIMTSSGAPVSQVQYSVQVMPVFSGEVTSLNYDSCSLFIAVDMATKQQLGSSGFSGNLVSDQWCTIAKGGVTAAQLESWAGSDGEHQLNISPSVIIKMTFSDGRTITRSADCCARWVFERGAAGDFGSLSVRVTHNPM